MAARPDFSKYQFRLSNDQDNLQNVKNFWAKPLIGGSALSISNPLRDQIKDVNLNSKRGGKYYTLHNIQKEQNQSQFVDVELLIESVPEQEVRRFESLEKLSTDLKITYWTKDMVYPFSHKFVLWDDIKEHFTGFARIIEFKCMAKGIDGYPDPTIENADRHNWITSISEGQFKKGMANGYMRYVNAHNGHCKMGYHLNGQAHGKWVEHRASVGHW